MGVKTVILVGLGFFFTALGAIGILIPVWPTTPFLIVATGCFSSTPKIRQKMLKIPFFSDHIRNYQDRTGLSKRSVISSLLFLWIMISISCILVETPWITIMLLLIATAVTVHILYMAKPRTKCAE